MSAEYGWSDKRIGELTLGRFRQITAAIQLRRWQSQREESARLSWQTRILAQYIAAGYMVEEGKPNSALEGAAFLGFDDVERAVVQAPQAASAPKQHENSTGSFERLMGFAGGMNKR